jgi:hypothetical protein
MLMKKIHSQPSPSTIGPPISQAVVAPIPPSAAQIPSALLRSAPSSKIVVMNRERGRGHDRRPDPLEGAGADQRPIQPGQPAEQRGEREHQDADHEHPPAPEQIGRPAAEPPRTATPAATSGEDRVRIGLLLPPSLPLSCFAGGPPGAPQPAPTARAPRARAGTRV